MDKVPDDWVGNAAVIGGTRRVGRWVSETLLEDGWSVQAVHRSNEQAAIRFFEEVTAQLNLQNFPLRLFPADFADEQAAANAISKGVASSTDSLDLLVCASGLSLTALLGGTTAAQFEALWRGNVLSAHNAVRAALPYLRKSRRGGRIVLFSVAGAGQRAFRDIPAYAACKSMLESYTRSLARELTPDGICVNCIALGVTSLPPDGAPEYDAGRLPRLIPVGQPDLAALIRFLASEGSSQLTGAVIPLSGGFGL